ncbi:hypothetical protein AAH092_11390 [Bacteroides xylanisolvens]|uniref:hypothetical protein n=1 Tax=Bacteroides xylanisolvens TaxID=371601 RepID=UPI0039B5D938
MNHRHSCKFCASSQHLLYGLGGSNQVVDSVGDEGAIVRTIFICVATSFGVSCVANHKRIVRVHQVLDNSPVRIVVAFTVADADGFQGG